MRRGSRESPRSRPRGLWVLLAVSRNLEKLALVAAAPAAGLSTPLSPRVRPQRRRRRPRFKNTVEPGSRYEECVPAAWGTHHTTPWRTLVSLCTPSSLFPIATALFSFNLFSPSLFFQLTLTLPKVQVRQDFN